MPTISRTSLLGLMCLALGASIAAPARATEPKPCNPEVWADAIAKFEEEDKKMPPPKQGVLFLGSSSIRLWDVQKSFPDMLVVNRGFGGSQICDSTHYAERLVNIHEPRGVVFYAGDNDIAGGKSPEQVRDDFRAFVEKVRGPQPELPIIFLAIKPSIARWKLADKIKEANRLIAEDFDEMGNMTYVDVWPGMLDEQGEPRKELFADDGLHMNDKGYEVWTELVTPLVEKKD
ncbi:SGNH/GDSL hydrolase family protein [Lacipirellula sp.]|uniref:SGNH/GDSL hydrolase family protein n=1 Tax=Lacipirellula sp. TaxID=2691419 RepID=UPI003D0F876B